MEIVIKIPEECYKQIQKHIFSIAYDAIKTKEEKKQVEEKFNVVLAIKNGTPLPKGHGRLIEEPTEEIINKTIGGKNDFADCIRDSVTTVFYNAPTIIEADRSEDGNTDIDK